MAKLTKDLYGAANGEVYPRIYAAGEDCPPELEDAAREIDALEEAEEGKSEGDGAPDADDAKPAKPGKA